MVDKLHLLRIQWKLHKYIDRYLDRLQLNC